MGTGAATGGRAVIHTDLGQQKRNQGAERHSKEDVKGEPFLSCESLQDTSRGRGFQLIQSFSYRPGMVGLERL